MTDDLSSNSEETRDSRITSQYIFPKFEESDNRQYFPMRERKRKRMLCQQPLLQEVSR